MGWHPTDEEFAAWARKFDENQRAFPQEELDKHIGKHVAWTRDGASIIASAEDLDTLDRLVREAGFDPVDVFYDDRTGVSWVRF